MSFENKKFLDIIGISHLWEKIKEQFIDVNELNIIVEAIDEVKADKADIVQADWSESDSGASSYVKNRTHYEELSYSEAYTITNNLDEEYTTVTTSRDIINPIISAERNLRFVFDGVSYDTFELIPSVDDAGFIYVYELDDFEFAISTKEYTSYEPEVLFRVNDYSVEHTLEIYIASSTVHPLDEKYLPESATAKPDWNQNDPTAPDYIKNRTHWSDKKEDIEVLTETFLSNGTDDGGIREFIFPAIFSLTEGEIYLVHWNGESYTVECKRQEEITYVGNIGIVDGLDTGEPFFIGLSDNNSSVYVYTSSDITEAIVSIIIPGEETVHKLDMKYLPDAISKNILDGSAKGSVRTIGANTEIGEYAFAEGEYTTASGYVSHAEGGNTTASHIASHAEGYWTTASSYISHAEGGYTTASGIGSHAEGYYTTASSEYQHAQGRFNIEDTENKYAHIVGNGKYSYDGSLNSNAHTLDWDGNAWFAGNIKIGGTGYDDEDAVEVATKTDLDSYEFITVADIDEICSAITATTE